MTEQCTVPAAPEVYELSLFTSFNLSLTQLPLASGTAPEELFYCLSHKEIKRFL